jgi:hypothetical protein
MISDHFASEASLFHSQLFTPATELFADRINTGLIGGKGVNFNQSFEIFKKWHSFSPIRLSFRQPPNNQRFNIA